MGAKHVSLAAMALLLGALGCGPAQRAPSPENDCDISSDELPSSTASQALVEVQPALSLEFEEGTDLLCEEVPTDGCAHAEDCVLRFGPLALGASEIARVRMKNPTEVYGHVSGITLEGSGEFTLRLLVDGTEWPLDDVMVDYPVTVFPRSAEEDDPTLSVVVEVTFTPTTLGTREALLVIESDAQNAERLFEEDAYGTTTLSLLGETVE